MLYKNHLNLNFQIAKHELMYLLQETLLVERVEETERERKILEHGLADKSAQLQLQTTKTEALEEDLAEARSMVAQLQKRLRSKHKACGRARKSVSAMSTLFSDFRSTFNQALTRLVNYQHRITFSIKRMQSLKGKQFQTDHPWLHTEDVAQINLDFRLLYTKPNLRAFI